MLEGGWTVVPFVGWRLSSRLIVVVLLLAAVEVVSATASESVERMVLQRAQAVQTRAITAQEHTLETQLVLTDMRGTVRTYVETRRPQLLSAIARDRTLLGRDLGTLPRGTPSTVFRRAVNDWLTGFVEPSIRMVQAGGPALVAARLMVWSSSTRDLYNAVKVRSGQLMTYESAAAYRAVRESSARSYDAKALIVIGSLLLELLVLLAVLLLFSGGITAIRRVAEELRSGHTDLAAARSAPPEIQQVAREIERFALRTALERDRLSRELQTAQSHEREVRLEALANEQLAQKRQEFLADVGHELRTPLTSILGFSDLLAASEDLGSQDREFVLRVHESGQQILHLVNALLDLEKIDAGHMELESEPCDALSIAQGAVASVAPQLQLKGLRCSVESHGASQCLADQARLTQVLLNLLSNAYKFTDPGGEVRVRVARDGDVVRISVADTGCGVPAEKLTTIFERFGQIGGRQSVLGTGLGLPLASRLVGLMNGRLKVESEVGRGSVFTVELPLAKPA